MAGLISEAHFGFPVGLGLGLEIMETGSDIFALRGLADRLGLRLDARSRPINIPPWIDTARQSTADKANIGA